MVIYPSPSLVAFPSSKCCRVLCTCMYFWAVEVGSQCVTNAVHKLNEHKSCSKNSHQLRFVSMATLNHGGLFLPPGFKQRPTIAYKKYNMELTFNSSTFYERNQAQFSLRIDQRFRFCCHIDVHKTLAQSFTGYPT